jgi:hypothetical protein
MRLFKLILMREITLIFLWRATKYVLRVSVDYATVAAFGNNYHELSCMDYLYVKKTS